jgi:diguanylate cyclase (GGDEF)-like protein
LSNNVVKHDTLIGQLENIVDSKHITKVKKVIDALLDINKFKYTLNTTEYISGVYSKIKDILFEKFNIKDFKIIQSTNNIQTIKYCTNKDITYNYSYKSDINEKGSIEFLLNNAHLNDFDKIYLDNYLEEIVHILYVQLIICELQTSSVIDPLTKLKNRLAFNEDMHEIIPFVLREKMNIGVLLINIDRFRAVNDEYGLEFGDKFLVLYAQTIKEVIRKSDIAVRFGGGEFLILLMNVLCEEKAMEIAENIKDRLAEVYLLTSNNDKFRKTVSIGVSMFPKDSREMNEVIKKSETALSDAKDQGRGQIVRYKDTSGELDLF